MPGKFSDHRRGFSGPAAGTLAVWLGVFAGATGLPADPLAVPAPPAITVHITDGQDRLMAGHLGPAAQARSQANALYAEAMLALDGPTGDRSQALAQLRQAVALDPHFPKAQVKIADLMVQSGRADAACAQLESARAANPGSVEIETALSYVQKVRGRTEEALRLAHDALTRDPGQATAMRVMLEIAGDQNDLTGGLIRVEDILKSDGPGVPSSAWLALGRLYIELARDDAQPSTGDAVLRTLLPLYQQAASKPPPEVQTLTLLSDTYKELGLQRDALRTLRQAAAMEPSNVDLLLGCAGLETDLGWQGDALKDYAAAYALDPGLVGLRQMLGQLYLENGQFNEAQRLLQEAMADSPEDPRLVLELTLTMRLAGNKELIVPTLQQGLARFPDNADLMNELAYFWADAGRNLPEALALSRRARALAPANGPIADTCGWVYFHLDRPKDALPYLQQAALLTNNDPVVLQHLGDTYLKLDRRRDAIATWRRALEKDPGNRDLAARIDAALAQATDAHLRSAPTK